MTHEEHLALETAFIEGFRQAGDKQGFLRLARIPLELDRAGQPGLKLMQVVIEDVVDVGRASPGFASRELVYHPLPATLVKCGPGCAFATSQPMISVSSASPNCSINRLRRRWATPVTTIPAIIITIMTVKIIATATPTQRA